MKTHHGNSTFSGSHVLYVLCSLFYVGISISHDGQHDENIRILLSATEHPSNAPSTSTTPWDLLVFADFHGAETFSIEPDTTKNIMYQTHLDTLTYIHDTYGGERVLLPGDSNTGKWHLSSYRDQHFPSLSIKETIYQASLNCYTTLRKLFNEAGFDDIDMAIGDHELGDNPWHANTSKANTIPDFRKGFRDGFNTNPNNGAFYYDGVITGKDENDFVASTPIGTDHEKLSYAQQYKNVLFVTMDLFEVVSTTEDYLDKEMDRGGNGVVTGTVRGNHLTWFETVLRLGHENPSIKHIIVQGHIPVQDPIRKVKSSAMRIDDAEDSAFWQVMVKYGVDLYLAGEVHSTTASKAKGSNLIQLVSRGNRLNSFLKIEVEEDKLRATYYNEIGPKLFNNKNYELIGELEIDKSDKTNTEISSSGELEILNLKKVLIRYDFETTVPMATRPIVGMRQMDGKTSVALVAESIELRGVTCTDALINRGRFGQNYDAQVAELWLFSNNAISGNQSAYFAGSETRHSLFSFGPHSSASIISFSLWIRTWNSSEMILVHYGATWNSQHTGSIFSLTLDNGKLKLYSGQSTFLTTTNTDKTLNDGQWHHIAVSMPKERCLLSDVSVFVDGTKETTKTPQNDETLSFYSYGRISLGGFGNSMQGYESLYPTWKPYKGSMDEFMVYGRKIGTGDIAWAMQKKFVKNWSFGCNDSNEKLTLQANLTFYQCEQRCKNNSWCFGYERITLENGFKQCSLFPNRPTKTNVKQKGVCATLH